MTEDLVPLQAYAACMEDIRARTSLVLSITSGELRLAREAFTIELACLQLRKTLEQIGFASLTANQSVYAAAYGDFSSHWNAKRLLANLDKLHPEFYPRPIIPAESPLEGVKHFDKIQDGYLTREDFVFLYNKTSKVLHTRNPFHAQPALVNFERSIEEWGRRIQRLLSVHYIKLAGLPDLWVVFMKHPEDGRVHVLKAVPRPPEAGTHDAT